MKQIKILMGMPINVEIVDPSVTENAFQKVFDYFTYIDKTFSTYKKTSEISRINSGEISENEYSNDMKTVFALSEKTKQETNGCFNIFYNGTYNPSGLVKGWAIHNAAKLLKKSGFENFYIDAGGDIQVSGKNKEGKFWKVGIRNPFNQKELVKVVCVSNQGVATSGTYIRGNHIYNPKGKNQKIEDLVSLTVIGPDIYEADRFATAAFAMGKKGALFIESLKGFEGYMINKKGIATYTSGFEKYIL
jgi:thiamine biosynthesis lipoprotein